LNALGVLVGREVEMFELVTTVRQRDSALFLRQTGRAFQAVGPARENAGQLSLLCLRCWLVEYQPFWLGLGWARSLVSGDRFTTLVMSLCSGVCTQWTILF